MNVLIVGRGRVGRGLGRALRLVDEVNVKLAGRRVAPLALNEAHVVVLAVPDDAIEGVAVDVAPELSTGAVVLHCAGSRGTDVLAACEARGCAVGVMHPLVSFPSKRATPSLGGTTFTLHGSPRAVSTARRLASWCGARAVVANTKDAAYHAAAALTANGAVGLAFAAVEVFERLGFERRDAERAVGGLLRTVADNVAELGVPGALTGPIARGEPETIARHRGALRRRSKRALSAYDAVLPVIVHCARAAGLPARKAREIIAQLDR
jgi:predicted short-subunit dehydrogenase-like oxidoreductase (DUF2520 family)